MRGWSARPEIGMAIDDSAAGIVAARIAGLTALGIAEPEDAEGLRRAGASLVVRDLLRAVAGRDLAQLAGCRGPAGAVDWLEAGGRA